MVERESLLATGDAHSDFSFAKISDYAVPMDVHTLLTEYADGRRSFNGVELKQVNLYQARLPFIHLDESNLYRADLRYANLAGASLNHADLSSSNLSNANCIGTDMVRAKLAGANIAGAFLSGANLSGANLRRTDLTHTSLAGANLSGVDFSGSIMKNTNLSGANFRGANLSEVDLGDLDLAQLNLAGAILNEAQAKLWQSVRPKRYLSQPRSELYASQTQYHDGSGDDFGDRGDNYGGEELDYAEPYSGFDEHDQAYASSISAVFGRYAPPSPSPEDPSPGDNPPAAHSPEADFLDDPLLQGDFPDEASFDDEDMAVFMGSSMEERGPFDGTLLEDPMATETQWETVEQIAFQGEAVADGDNPFSTGSSLDFPQNFPATDPAASGSQALVPYDPAALRPEDLVWDPPHPAEAEDPNAPAATILEEPADDLALAPVPGASALAAPALGETDPAEWASAEMGSEVGILEELAAEASAFADPAFEASVLADPDFAEPAFAASGLADSAPEASALAESGLAESGLAESGLAELAPGEPPSPPELQPPTGVPAKPPTPLAPGAALNATRFKQTNNSRVVQSIQSALNRQVQYSLQQKLLEVYNYQCAITRCSILPLLETTLIASTAKTVLDHPSNGLVLRRDLKTLYDLHLLAIHPKKLTVMLAPTLLQTDYASLKGKKILVPSEPTYKPSFGFLKQHLLDCKWYAPTEAALAEMDELAPISADEGSEDRPSRTHRPFPLPRPVAVGLAGALACGALVGSLWLAFGQDRTSDPLPTPPSEHPQATPTSADNTITIEAGPLRYPHQGMVWEGSAYLPLALADSLGLEANEISPEDQIEEANGTYFKAEVLKNQDISVTWDAETRTLTLDCCTTTDIESISVKVNNQDRETQGMILNNSAYIPADILSELEVDPSQLPTGDFVEYDQTLYVKAAGLKALAIESAWDAETRTLSLSHQG